MNINKALQSAFIYYETGQLKDAELIYKKILKKRSDNIDALHFLGIINFQFGNYDQSIVYIRKELKFAPNDADAHNNLGLAFQGKGQFGEAIKCYRKAIELNPTFFYTYYNLGNVLKEKKLFDEAIACYQHSINLNPSFAAAYNNTGVIFQEKGEWDKASYFFQEALRFSPNNANIYNNIGLVLWKMGHMDEANNYFQKALTLKPDLPDAYNNLGNVCRDKGKPGEAIIYFQKALGLNKTFADAYYNLGLALNEDNRLSEALSAFEEAIICRPNHFKSYWARCISHLKVIYRDLHDIHDSRRLYVEELKALRDTIFNDTSKDIEAAAAAVGSCQPFYLAYQGLNDRDIQKIYGELVCSIMASRYPEWSNNTPTISFLKTDERLRIGIVSGHFYNHSVWKIPIRGWVMNINRQHFSLYGYYTGNKKDEETEVARQHFDCFVEDTYSFEQLCQRIKEDNLHILIYPEIGMDPTTVRLAALKLAPVQCTSWGHPDTSGLPTIDYYLSSVMIEPPDADDHYTEKLIRLPNMSIYYSPTEAPHADVDRKTFGLRQTSVLYHCCQSLYKYLPQYDEIFPRIASLVGNCQFLFSSDKKSSRVTEQFQSRITQAFKRFGLNSNDHAVFLPFLDAGQYNAIYRLADVFLDPVGWSGCNTALEAVHHNLPVLTFPSNLMRGRETLAILSLMGITETIAGSLDQYIEFAARLGMDLTWRHQISEKIAANKHTIYHDRICITALENFLESVVNNRYESGHREVI